MPLGASHWGVTSRQRARALDHFPVNINEPALTKSIEPVPRSRHSSRRFGSGCTAALAAMPGVSSTLHHHGLYTNTQTSLPRGRGHTDTRFSRPVGENSTQGDLVPPRCPAGYEAEGITTAAAIQLRCRRRSTRSCLSCRLAGGSAVLDPALGLDGSEFHSLSYNDPLATSAWKHNVDVSPATTLKVQTTTPLFSCHYSARKLAAVKAFRHS